MGQMVWSIEPSESLLVSASGLSPRTGRTATPRAVEDSQDRLVGPVRFLPWPWGNYISLGPSVQILPLDLSARTSEALWTQFANRPPSSVEQEQGVIAGELPVSGQFRGGHPKPSPTWRGYHCITLFSRRGSIISNELSKPNLSLLLFIFRDLRSAG